LSERARPGAANIGIRQHADEILQLLEKDDLTQVVLVGHSYAGNVISLVADTLKIRAAAGDLMAQQRVKHYVFLDAVVPRPEVKQWSWGDEHSAQVRASRLEAIALNKGMLPVPRADVFGLASPSDAQWIQTLMTPMPGACYTEPVQCKYGATRGLARTYIAAVKPAYSTLVPVHARIAQEPGWRYIEAPCGHEVMVDMPQWLVEQLLAI
jgi:pimeloyl-ACP methyl ester carboxylesterase